MAVPQKMITCKACGNLIAENAKVCPYCGAKNKKPIYKRGWFIAIAVIVVIGVIGSISSSFNKWQKNRGEEFIWGEIELNSVLPEPKSNRGEIITNSENSLFMYIHKISKEQYKDYVSKCQDMGFIVESEKTERSYSAYNETGYKLSTTYYESDKRFSIRLEAPEKMDTLQWPTSELVSLLPVPKSQIGKISSESSDHFFVYVGETPIDDYRDYVDQCSAAGFTVDYEKGEEYYNANNSDGYHISVRYQGNSVMTIEITKPEADEEPEPTVPETAAPETAAPETTAPEPTPSADTTTDLVDGMRPEFKKAMDSYEAFYDKYCEVLQKYKENPSDLSLLTEYTNLISELAEMDEAFAEWGDADLNDVELNYYLEVSARIYAKLMAVA